MSVEWLCKDGHQFEPRYDSEPMQELRANGMATKNIEAVMRGIQKFRYVRDVCVKCGKTIERGK